MTDLTEQARLEAIIDILRDENRRLSTENSKLRERLEGKSGNGERLNK